MGTRLQVCSLEDDGTARVVLLCRIPDLRSPNVLMGGSVVRRTHSKPSRSRRQASLCELIGTTPVTSTAKLQRGGKFMVARSYMRIVIVAIASILLGYGVGSARGQSLVYGHGNLSCGRWTEDNKRGRDDSEVWVLGFVSGAAWASPEPQRQTDSDAMAAWIDQYCGAHPLDTIQRAASVLALELERKR